MFHPSTKKGATQDIHPTPGKCPPPSALRKRWKLLRSTSAALGLQMIFGKVWSHLPSESKGNLPPKAATSPRDKAFLRDCCGYSPFNSLISWGGDCFGGCNLRLPKTNPIRISARKGSTKGLLRFLPCLGSTELVAL